MAMAEQIKNNNIQLIKGNQIFLENMKLNEGEGKILSEAELSELRLKGSK